MSGYDEVDEMIEKIKSNAEKRMMELFKEGIAAAALVDELEATQSILAMADAYRKQCEKEAKHRREKRVKRLARSG